jgi:uncharacterized damage-inducible protein DinB
MTRSAWYDALAHHTWATERILEACASLSREQLVAPVPGTYGPIIATLAHMVATDGWYLSFFLEFENPIGEDPNITIDQLRAANAVNGERWQSVLAEDRDPESEIVERNEEEGWEFITPLAFRYAQAVHHGTDHRSQVCTALSSLGIEPPEIDVWAYGEATGRTRAARLVIEGG